MSHSILTKYHNSGRFDDKLKQVSGGTSKYFLGDHLGSTVGIANSSGTVTDANSYDSFGDPTNGSFPLRYQFTGRELDPLSGQMYYRARFYDSNLGRFVSEDPIGIYGGDINLFAYLKNDPINQIDPLGLYPFSYGNNPYDMIPDWGWTAIAYTGTFAAGFGDHVTSVPFTDIKITQEARILLGSDDTVDKCGYVYAGGEWTGFAWEIAAGGAAGWKAAGSRAAGSEFSHWLPKRAGGPRSLWNGNFVTIKEHALSDPYRYRFMPRIWKSGNPMPSQVVQQWNRIPNVYKGGASGVALGGSKTAVSACECK